MNGRDILIDTNIALYLLSGQKAVADLLQGNRVYVSFITELELLGYQKLTKLERGKVQDFISNCVIVDINHEIKEHAISIRRSAKLKLPDCIIAATSLYLGAPLFTADADFKNVAELTLLLFDPH